MLCYTNRCVQMLIRVSERGARFLPTSKRRLIRSEGSVDELMFEACLSCICTVLLSHHSSIHQSELAFRYTVEIYQPLSTLIYSPIEAVSWCAPLAPSENL